MGASSLPWPAVGVHRKKAHSCSPHPVKPVMIHHFKNKLHIAHNGKRNSNHNIKKLVLSFYLVLILFTLITATTYTWFSISRTPKVSDMNLYVNSASRLELALDPNAEAWTLQLDLQDIMPASTPLRPITWVDEEQQFYAVSYTPDGRMRDIAYWNRLNDERNANKDTLDGYYIKLSFYARATTGVNVTLSPAVEIDQGIYGAGTFVIGEPVWNPDADPRCHTNAGLGAETAVRIGIRITPLDEEGIPAGEESTFFIYEPNCDNHVNGSSSYTQTPSITGSPNLIAEEYLIRQGASTWTESNPVEQGKVIKDLGEFWDSPTLFSLDAGEKARIDLYIWLEGQDADCVDLIRKAHILACLQFDADPIGGSGLQPIE